MLLLIEQVNKIVFTDRITAMFLLFWRTRLCNDPRYLVKNEVEKLLIHEGLVFPNEIIGAKFLAISRIGSGPKGSKLGLENVE
jgi:hypothetical protein